MAHAYVRILGTSLSFIEGGLPLSALHSLVYIFRVQRRGTIVSESWISDMLFRDPILLPSAYSGKYFACPCTAGAQRQRQGVGAEPEAPAKTCRGKTTSRAPPGPPGGPTARQCHAGAHRGRGGIR